MSEKHRAHDEDDITIETELGDSDGAALKDPQETIHTLKEKLKRAEAERKEYLDGWQRMKADLANYKKDEEARHGKVREYATEGLLNDLLAVEESFQMAFSNRESWESVSKEWRTGIEYIHSQFMKVLSDYGITVIDPQINDAFDPLLHESVGTAPVTDPSREGTVQGVQKRGFLLRERVLAPARVILGSHITQ